MPKRSIWFLVLQLSTILGLSAGPITVDFEGIQEITPNQVATAHFVFSSNLASSGDPGSSPNELLSVRFSGVSSLMITGDPAGGSFVLNDLNYAADSQTAVTGSIFRPISLLGGLMGVLLIRQRRRSLSRSALRGVVIIAAFSAVPALAQHTLGGTFVSPHWTIAGQPSQFTFQISITDPKAIPSSVNLVRKATNGAITVVDRLHDDGVNGDAVAGDGIYTWQGAITEPAIGQVTYQTSVAFLGSLLRVEADFQPIFVQAANGASSSLAALSASLAAGDVASAITYFEDTSTASALLGQLGSAALGQLASSFSAARLVSTKGDLKIYIIPWTPPGGTALDLEIILGIDFRGNWLVIT